MACCILKAARKASAVALEPKYDAMSISRRKPRSLLNNVVELIMPIDLIIFFDICLEKVSKKQNLFNLI